jgi:hypothetical protein
LEATFLKRNYVIFSFMGTNIMSCINEPSVNTHRLGAAGFKPKNGSNPFHQGLGQHLWFFQCSICHPSQRTLEQRDVKYSTRSFAGAPATPFSKVGMFSPSLQTADQMVS